MDADELRVLHLIDTGGPGGAETVCLNLAKGLQGQVAHQTVVVPERDWLYGELRTNGLSPELRSTRPGGFDLAFGRWLLTVVRARQINIIQTHLLGSATYGSLVGHAAGVPSVCTFHGTPDFAGPQWLLAAKLRAVVGGANRLVCVSDYLKMHVLSRFRFAERASVTIYNGVDFSRSTPSSRQRSSERSSFHLCAVGNARPAKDYPTLIRTVAWLREHDVPCFLVVAGQPPADNFRALRELAAGLGVEPYIEFRGFQPDIGAIFAETDVFVSSSTSEGFSLATVEAMAHGVPAVVTRSGGPEEIIVDGESGLLVPPSNPAALGCAIARLYREPDLARSIATQGAQHVRKEFSMTQMVGRYRELYCRTLKEADPIMSRHGLERGEQRL